MLLQDRQSGEASTLLAALHFSQLQYNYAQGNCKSQAGTNQKSLQKKINNLGTTLRLGPESADTAAQKVLNKRVMGWT